MVKVEEVYSQKIELEMYALYRSLSENDRRRYAASEANKVGYGGVSYIGRVLHCDYRTILRGQHELQHPELLDNQRVRKSGGGRKLSISIIEGIDQAFLEVIESSTAGSPMDDAIKWTNLSRPAIALALKEKGISVGVKVISQLLKKHNYCKRKAFKNEAGKTNIAHRDEQFRNIENFKKAYHEQNNPVMSMDVKKKSSSVISIEKESSIPKK